MHSPNDTPPGCRRQLLDWLHKPWLDTWLVAVCAHFIAILCPFRRLGAFLYRTIFIWPQCAVRQYHSDLSDQSALESRVRIRVRLKVALF